MKTINEIVTEAKRKEFQLNKFSVVKGQQLKVKNPYDDSKSIIVNYLKPHNSSTYYYAIDGSGRQLALRVEDVLDIIPFVVPERKKSNTPRKMSWETANKLYDEISELESQVRDLMMDQEEYAAQAMQNHPELDADAPNYDSDFNNCWKEIDKLSAKIQKIRTKLENAGY